jgi:hypothetical protein
LEAPTSTAQATEQPRKVSTMYEAQLNVEASQCAMNHLQHTVSTPALRVDCIM